MKNHRENGKKLATFDLTWVLGIGALGSILAAGLDAPKFFRYL